MSLIYQKYSFSDYVSSYIIRAQNIESYPILIFYDQTVSESYYYSLIIQNKILIENSSKSNNNINNDDLNIKKVVIPINISDILIGDLSNLSNLSDLNIYIYSLISKYINQTYNPLNNFIIIDCLFDYKKLIDILNNFINYCKNQQSSSQIVQLFKINFIISCLNYYNINELFIISNYDIICLTNFINICTENNIKNDIDSISSYKNLNQSELTKLIVNTNNYAINQYIEIKNVFFIQKQQSFYKIYFLYNNSINAVNYVNQWNKFDNSLIKYINSIDKFQNLNKYNIIINSSYICDTVNNKTIIGYLIKMYKINFIYNYNNNLFIDQYQMGKMNKQIMLMSNNIYNTNNLSDSIYKINGSYFNLSYYLDFSSEYPKIYILSESNTQSNTQSVEITDITNFYKQIDINENGEYYKLIIISNFKYDQVNNIIKNININDPLMIIQPMININNYYIFFIIITKHQFRITRYKINNNKLILDDKMKVNQYYNCAILESNYLSDLFLTPIIINNNIID